MFYKGSHKPTAKIEVFWNYPVQVNSISFSKTLVDRKLGIIPHYLADNIAIKQSKRFLTICRRVTAGPLKFKERVNLKNTKDIKSYK